MSAKTFAIELGRGPASDRRLQEGLDLAAGLAAFDHRVELILHASALARLGGSREGDELRTSLDSAAEMGVGPALTEAAGAPERIGTLALTQGDPAAVRARVDACVVF